MRVKIKNVILALVMACGFAGAVGVVPAAALSPVSPIVAGALKNDACQGLTQVDTTQGCGTNSNGTVSNLLQTVINILSLVIGIAAVIALIISGLKFITAQGDSSAIATARSTIVYALVGLVIASLAQIIVHFVLAKI